MKKPPQPNGSGGFFVRLRSLLSFCLLRLPLLDHIHQPLGQGRVVFIEVVTTGQLDRFAHRALVGAAAFVDFFLTVDAHHFGGGQLGHFRAGGGFLAGVAEPTLDFDFEAAGAGEGQQDNGVDALLLGLTLRLVVASLAVLGGVALVLGSKQQR